jgi:hypothetical protein
MRLPPKGGHLAQTVDDDGILLMIRSIFSSVS